MTDADLAAHLAETAGRLLVTVRDAGIFSGKALGDVGDRTADEFLVSALREQRPDDGLLSEERRCDGTRLGIGRVWIIDPLDGTREYADGRADWAVHVGLAINGVARVGAVALPAAGAVFRSDAPRPAPPASGRPRIAISRTRPPAEAKRVADQLGATLLPMGSAGAKAMAVVAGDADIYLHAGGQHEWDSCAPVAVAVAHGLHCSRIDGAPLIYNQSPPYLPDLLICRPELAAGLLALIGEGKAPSTG